MAGEAIPKTVRDEIDELKRQVAALRKATPLNNASLSGVVTVLDGRVESDDYEEGAAGWSLQPDLAEFNNLRLRGGIIGNDALENPVTAWTNQDGVGNYEITTTSTVRISVNLVVPDGFTMAIVQSTASAMGYNNTTGADYLYVQAVIQGENGGELYSSAPAGYGVGLSVPYNKVLTGLTDGDTITIGVATRTATSAWAASGANQANIYAQAIYLR